jgi:putative hemolysin
MNTSCIALQASTSYSVRLAAHEQEVREAQHLRFQVFNLELNEGLAASYATERDEDPFDACCDHLIVVHHADQSVVGTYRLQTGVCAALNRGYYCAQEFDMAPFEGIRTGLVELGRACVHGSHRNRTVLSLLWKGIASYAAERNCRYVIGCSSLTSQDEAEGAALYHSLAARFLSSSGFRTRPLPGFAFPLAAEGARRPSTPKLLGAYLALGAQICGAPAIDREFGTIDFLTFLDFQAMPSAARKHFFA